MRRRSRPLVRPSTTSPRTSNATLESLIDALPAERLENVFTHTSWAPDRGSSYERLEFLGDSVLELAIARELFERFPDYAEGQLAKIRSHVVSRASCAVVSRELYGFEKIEDAVVAAFAGRIEYARTTYVDHKTELQEAVARLGRSVTYTVVDVDGPPHDRIFTCAVVIDGDEAGIGKGPSKKVAEQEAAREALAMLGVQPT